MGDLGLKFGALKQLGRDHPAIDLARDHVTLEMVSANKAIVGIALSELQQGLALFRDEVGQDRGGGEDHGRVAAGIGTERLVVAVRQPTMVASTTQGRGLRK